MIFGGLTVTEWLILGSAIFGVVGGYYQLLNNHRSLREDMEHLEKSGEQRGSENRKLISEVKVDIDQRLKPLEAEMKVNASYIASQAANISAIHTQLQNITSQLNTIITHMWADNRKK